MDHQEFYKHSAEGYINQATGIFRKTLTFGENSLLSEFKMEKGHQLPLHQHPHEQVGYLVSGHIILHIAAESYDVFPGDSWAILGNTPHSADILADSVAIEVFSPRREDYLP